jgi:hypothetical protein
MFDRGDAIPWEGERQTKKVGPELEGLPPAEGMDV